MVNFKLSVKGSDVSKDVKGKDIGNAIQKMEFNKFLNEIDVPSPSRAGVKKNKTDKISGYKKVNEAQAVSGGKVQKFITGHNLKMKGKRYKEIEFETLGVDNSSKMVKLKIIAPKNLFGIETPVKFSTLRRGPFTKTDTGKKRNEICFSGLSSFMAFSAALRAAL